MNLPFTFEYLPAFIALSLFILSFLFAKFFSPKEQPKLFFSDLKNISSISDLKTKILHLPRILQLIAFFLALIAFTNPEIKLPKNNQDKQSNNDNDSIPKEGIAIYLLLDKSGSMAEEVSATINGNRQMIKKETLMKDVTIDFVNQRKNDLIGLISFARVPDILSPLTLDHQAILADIQNVEVVKEQDNDGTAIGYAIFKTVNMIDATKHFAENNKQIKSAYEIKNAIIIVVTDGLQDPSILDRGSPLRNIGLIQAANSAKKSGIKVYVINIDPATFGDQFAPQRHQMQEAAELTGGKLFILNDPGNLSQVFQSINTIEKEKLPQSLEFHTKDNNYIYIALYPYLAFISLLLIFISFSLNHTLLRKVP